MKTAPVWITYQRVSTKDQEREGLSIPAQAELNTAYVRQQGAIVSQEFTESSSATKRDRKQFDAMLAFVARQRGPVCMVAKKTDRLYRTWEEYVQVQRLLKEHQLTIHFSKERQILHRDSPASDVLYHMMTTMFAAYYPINLSAEVKKGLRQKLLRGGWPTKPPYGYVICQKQVVIDPQTAQFVRRAYGLYATGGYSLDALRERLLAEGLAYRPEAPRVSCAQLSDILKNPFYVGVMEWGGETYEGSHERMVSADTWARAQAAARLASEIARKRAQKR